MAAEATGGDLGNVVALLAAAVVAVPLFKRAGLGAVLGYLAAGVIMGPSVLGLFSDPQAILHVAELGVVLLLFIIGLEMEPSRLWGLRRQIFGLGLAQVVVCGAMMTGAGMYYGFTPAVAFVAAMGFVLTSTAVVLQVIDERGETSTPAGQKMVSILLLEDLAIVPLLAIVAFLSPRLQAEGGGFQWQPIAIAIAALVALVVAGRYLLNPLFRLLAQVKAREIMTAAALLVVLGSALLMQVSGLSMAMGAFLAGVLLSESSFRHQLEADIEPFRGLLLGLFFLSVGMTVDLGLMAREWRVILMSVAVYMIVKSIGIYGVAMAFRSSQAEAVQRAALMAQGGEFAFVLYAAATTAGVFDGATNAALTATVIISMALTPLLVLGLRFLPTRTSMEGIDAADDLKGTVLIIGFGRVGQVMSQLLLARGVEVSIIDVDTEMIRSAEEFGFKVYYGDGTRLDVLRHSGAETATAIAICVNDQAATDKIVAVCKEEFPNATLLVRSFDREHAHKLIAAGVDLQVRETFESALVLGEMALKAVGADDAEAAEIVEDIRKRDAERFRLEVAAGGGLAAGAKLLHSNKMKPTPLTPPKRPVAATPDQAAGGDGATPAAAERPVPETAAQKEPETT